MTAVIAKPTTMSVMSPTVPENQPTPGAPNTAGKSDGCRLLGKASHPLPEGRETVKDQCERNALEARIGRGGRRRKRGTADGDSNLHQRA